MLLYAVSWTIVLFALDADRSVSRGFLCFNSVMSLALLLTIFRGSNENVFNQTVPGLLMFLAIITVIYGVHRFWNMVVAPSVNVLALIACASVIFFSAVLEINAARVTSICAGLGALVVMTMLRIYAPIRREFGAVASNGLTVIVAIVFVSLIWRIYLALLTSEPPNLNRASMGSELSIFIVHIGAFTPNLLFAYFVAARLVQRANNAARTDGLTGLLNHRAFMDEADRLWGKRRARAVKGAALAIDIDFFKRINDLHGHATGDQVLQTFAQILRSVCVSGCVVGRTGGEEFVVLLAPANKATADAMAERLMRRVKRARWTSPDGIVIGLSVSIGIAFDSPTDLRPNDLLSRADSALYSAKETGRDRIVYA